MLEILKEALKRGAFDSPYRVEVLNWKKLRGIQIFVQTDKEIFIPKEVTKGFDVIYLFTGGSFIPEGDLIHLEVDNCQELYIISLPANRSVKISGYAKEIGFQNCNREVKNIEIDKCDIIHLNGCFYSIKKLKVNSSVDLADYEISDLNDINIEIYGDAVFWNTDLSQKIKVSGKVKKKKRKMQKSKI